MPWKWDGSKYAALRDALQHTQTRVAKLAGFSVRAISDAMNGRTEFATDELTETVAEVLKAQPADFAEHLSEPAVALVRAQRAREALARHRAAKLEARALAAPPPVNVHPTPAGASPEELPPLLGRARRDSKLTRTIVVEESRPLLPKIHTPFGVVRPLVGRRLRRVICSSGSYVDRLYYATGTVDDFYGLTQEEGNALFSSYQRGARFLVVRDVGDQVHLWTTVHTYGPRETAKLQAFHDTDRIVTVVLRVVCAEVRGDEVWVSPLETRGGEMARTVEKGGAGFKGWQLFWRERKQYPFALVVEAIAAGAVREDGVVVKPDGTRAPWIVAAHVEPSRLRPARMVVDRTRVGSARKAKKKRG